MSLNLALVVSGNASGAKDAAQQTKAEIGSIRAEAVSASAAMAAANDQAVASSRRVTEALATQAAAERNLRSAIDQRMNIGAGTPTLSTPFANNALRGADIEAYGRSLDALRARFNPIYAAIAQYKQAVMEAQQAERLGAISADERTAAIGRQRVATLASIAAIKAQQVAANTNGPRLSGFQLQGLGYQANDVLTMAAMGAPMSQIAASQGGQIFQTLQMGEGGVSGSLAAIRGSAAAAGSALVGMLGTIGLITAGLGLTAIAAGAFYIATRDKAKDLKEATEAQRQAVLDLAQAYGIAGVKADDFGQKSKLAASADVRQSSQDLRTAAYNAGAEALGRLTSVSGATFARAGAFTRDTQSEFAKFDQPIKAIVDGFKKGRPDFEAFDLSIRSIVSANPGLQTTADKIIGIVEPAREAAQQLGLTAKILDKINEIRLPERGFLPKGAAGDELDAATIANQYRMRQQFNADLLGINARSPEELAAAARARASLNPSGSAAEQATRVELAGKKALIEAEHQLTLAQQQRLRSMAEAVASAGADAASVGKSIAQTAALRFEHERLAQVREEAAQNGITGEAEFQRVFGNEIASIHAAAVEYGKFMALQEARSTIRGQQDDIELQRAELGLVGQSTLAHDRAIAALKTEQEIRRLGIPLYGQEAEAMRANTAAKADLAEQTAKATLQQQLLFERQQMFRSSIEQTVASTMRNAGMEYDPNSMIAQQIRYNEQLKATKASWEDIFNTVNNGIDGISDALFSGGSIEDAIRKAGQQLAKTVFDMAATNPIENWLTGSNKNTIADLGIFSSGAWSGKGGGFGGVLGQVLGAQKAVASMQVQAASVFINGSPIGAPGLGGLLGQNGFKPDTTLSDLLGYGAANQNGPNTPETAARLLAGLGSPLGFGTDSTATNSIARTASGGGVAAQVWNFFASKGLKDFQIAGILGNVRAESAFNPLAVGDRGNALGLFQWNDRAPSLLNAIGGRGNLGDVQSQLQFAWKELQSTEGLALRRLTGSTDVRGATAAFAGFERPEGFSWANPENAHNFAGRLAGAQEALSRFGGSATSATSAVSQLGGASSSVMSSLVSSTGTAAKGLDVFGSGAGKLGSMLNQFPAAPAGGGGGGGLFGWLGGLFGLGGGGASIASMNAISPMATANILSGSWGLFAKGAAFRNGNVMPFAKGDVFSTPTYFPMSAGRTGVMGEDGDEAIMPLQRGPDGRLGVVNHQPLRAPRAANSNGSGGGSSGGLTRAHIEGIVSSIADKLRLTANIVNLQDGSDIKRWLMSEDGHAAVAVVNKRIAGK